MNSALVMCAIICASVVLPVPGGPQKISEPVSSRSICVRSGLPGAEHVLLPNEFVQRARTHAVSQRAAAVARVPVFRDGLKKPHTNYFNTETSRLADA